MTDSPGTVESPAVNVPAGPRPAGPPARGRLVLALVAGLVVALALGWTLLSLALSLMFMLGLFFYMLFGLLIGAVMYRFGDGSQPVAKPVVVSMSLLVALTGWVTAVLVEADAFPVDFADAAIRQRKVYIPAGEYARVRGELVTFVEDYLQREFPPGGIVGYLKMSVAGPSIEVDIPSQPRTVTRPPRTQPWVWVTRTLLAVVLLFVAIYSVTSGLTRRRQPVGPAPPADPAPGSQQAGSQQAGSLSG